MLQHARQRGCYDDLEEAELTRWLEDHPDRYDLIVSADTLVYFGGLERVLRAAYWALAPAGGLVFTLEQSAEASGFRINPSGRYAHGGDYVQTALVADGWRMLALERAELRTERGRPVAGWLVVAQKSG
jgi:predicted TPR repeat methyltransferase